MSKPATYKVLLDGIDIYNTMVPLVTPTLKQELNASGSFEFTLMPTHIMYNDVKILKSTIDIYELTNYDEELGTSEYEWIFRGRPLNVSKDLLNRKKYYCEGALAFFNDTIMDYKEYEKSDTTTYSFITDLLARHNALVEDDRKIQIGTITGIPLKTIYRVTNFETTLECLTSMCLETQGGYMNIRYSEVEGVKTMYLDWCLEINTVRNQPIRFSLNLQDISQEFSGEELYSAVIPLGENDPNTDIPITIVGATIPDTDPAQTQEVPYLFFSTIYDPDNNVDLYGKIFKTVTFEGYTSSQDLYNAAVAWIANQNFAENLNIECSAYDLHWIDPEHYASFKVGTLVNVISAPHGLNRPYPILKIEKVLNESGNTITVGTPSKPTLTEITKPLNKKYVYS